MFGFYIVVLSIMLSWLIVSAPPDYLEIHWHGKVRFSVYFVFFDDTDQVQKQV